MTFHLSLLTFHFIRKTAGQNPAETARPKREEAENPLFFIGFLGLVGGVQLVDFGEDGGTIAALE